MAQITGSTPEEAMRTLKRTRGDTDEAIEMLFEDNDIQAMIMLRHTLLTV